jgi:hypothetical protein
LAACLIKAKFILSLTFFGHRVEGKNIIVVSSFIYSALLIEEEGLQAFLHLSDNPSVDVSDILYRFVTQ